MSGLKALSAGVVAVAVLAVLPRAAAAHEPRLVGPNGEYTLLVGFRVEPAFEDNVNAAEIVVTRTSDQRPINRSAGDVVDLQLKVQLREAEAFDAPSVQSGDAVPPQQIPGLANRYASPLRPTVDGTYAFRFRGTISDASSPLAGPVVIDETFVCGAGTRGPSSFNCVVDVPAFPKGLLDRGGHDRHGYFDDDSLLPFRRPD